jgi:hypothetical protein
METNRFSQVLGSPYIDGETKNEDREKSLNMFRYDAVSSHRPRTLNAWPSL